MSDWRATKQRELLEKQKHISQKLAQVRDLMAIVRKWRVLLSNYEGWFAGREAGAESSKWFDVQSLIRMSAITVQLHQLVGELEQVGDPKTTGTGSAPPPITTTNTGPTQSLEQRLHANSAEVLTATAGPLATSAPWELVWHIDPEVSESVRQGEMGAAITQVILNPFTSLSGMGFAKEITKMSQELIENHPEEFAALEESWGNTKEALESITATLNGLDLEELRQLEEGLEETLGDYERAYDGAQGEDGRSARQLRQAAAGT